MKALNTRYLILLLLLSLGSATAHALIDHDYHGCTSCILSNSNKNSVVSDLIDLDDVDNDFALLATPINFYLVVHSSERFSVNITANNPFYSQRLYSIRAPPNS